MSETNKPGTPSEQWEAVRKTALGPEARELDEESDADVDAALRASGIDPDALATDGQVLAEKLMRDAGLLPARDVPPEPVQAESPVIDLASRRIPRWPMLLVAATMSAAVATAGILAADRDVPKLPPENPPYPTEEPKAPPAPPPLMVAARLREEADREGLARNWQGALDKLNQARALDPAGDKVERTRMLRTTAMQELLRTDAAKEQIDKALKSNGK